MSNTILCLKLPYRYRVETLELQKLKGRCKGLFRRTACLLASAALILPLLIPAVPAAGSGGTFLGGNHTISGVSITGDGSH